MRISLFALALGLAFTAVPATAAEQPEAQITQIGHTMPAIQRPVPRQNTDPWNTIVLGRQGTRVLRVGGYGCAVFALRDALEEWGYRHEPTEFVALLQSNRMLPNGRLLWEIERLHPDLVSERRAIPVGADALAEALRLTREEGALVLLLFGHEDGGGHWVFLSPRPASDGSPMVRDPKWGAELALEALYDEHRIKGFVVIRRRPVQMAATPSSARPN